MFHLKGYTQVTLIHWLRGETCLRGFVINMGHTACPSVQSDQHPIVTRLLEVSNLTSHKATYNVTIAEPDFGRIIQRQVFSW